MNKIEELLTRRVDKIYPSKEALEKVLHSGKKLRLYMGIDPTASQLHLGHTVGLRKLMEFANLGHDVIFLFGTGTVLVGDPSERDSGRQLITQKEIDANIKTWKEQVKPVVDFNKIRILQNGDWLTKLNLKDIINIGSKISAIQLFKRDNFTQRLAKGDTVWYHETLYPLLQGYDSVVMDVDLEIGGTDQTFNMLMGRELQHKFRNKEKYVLTLKMINGTDGKPMSKTARNCIWLDDNPRDMFGKIMATADNLIADYFEFFTDLPIAQLMEIKNQLKNGKINPMTLKKQLALEITKQFHGLKSAEIAQAGFEQVHQKGKLPTDIQKVKIKVGKWDIVDLLVELKLAESRSEAKRLVQQGAVEINQQPAASNQLPVNIKPGNIIKVGKRKWVKII